LTPINDAFKYLKTQYYKEEDGAAAQELDGACETNKFCDDFNKELQRKVGKGPTPVQYQSVTIYGIGPVIKQRRITDEERLGFTQIRRCFKEFGR
jgi:hypothetical protein